MKIVNVSPENTEEHSFFCIKNIKEPGFKAKNKWFNKRYSEGLRIKVVYSNDEKLVGFIEYVPAEFAWRPVDADNWLFIHCIMVYPNKYRSSGAATNLINEAISEAKEKGLNGVCTMSSQGSWIATKQLFLKAGFEKADKKGRFELMSYRLKPDAINPKFIDWENELKKYNGWHLRYADQCPWHEKGVQALIKSAAERKIKLNIKKIKSSSEAKKMPSGFGVFALIKDGKLLEDHYISKRRFETIVEKEMKN